MIKNDRQYRITRAQLDRFQKALEKTPSKVDNRIHPEIQKAQRAAIASQLEDLARDVEEYEALKAGKVSEFVARSFVDLPRALIQARIARGMTQKELAEKLGLKEQQIQRYEASDYGSASIKRLQTVADALEVVLGDEVVLEGSPEPTGDFIKELKQVGMDQKFVFGRLLPKSLAARFELSHEAGESDFGQATSILERIFAPGRTRSWGVSGLTPDPAIAGQTRFKMAARAHEGRMAFYTMYAHFLASIVAHAADDEPQLVIPSEWKEVRSEILDRYGDVSFATGIRYAWDLGVVVLPLSDSGVFDAACWRIQGRNVIVLKQGMRSASRWLFDLLHELHHLAADQSSDELAIIDFDDSLLDRRTLPEEDEAHEFAGDVILDGRAEELTQLCVNEADGRVEYLKNAAQTVAMREGVQVDALANYLAFRLSLQGINWWGTATNLQVSGPDPFVVSRDELLRRLQLGRLDDIERELISQALHDVQGLK